MKLTEPQKERLLKTSKKLAIYLTVGFAYYLFVKITTWRIPCLLTLFTGGYCPGCGITRMFMALGELDFAKAFRCNMLVMISLPFVIGFGLWHWAEYVKKGETKMLGIERVLIIIAALLAVVFWILRNIPAFSFLAPI